MARVVVLSRRSVEEPLRIAGIVTLAAMALMMVLVVLAGSPVAAQESDQEGVTTTEATTEATSDGPSSVGNILPRPNSGQAPDSPNDPGGWQQYMVFALIGLGLLAIVVFATRDSRRIRRAQGRYP